VVIDLLSVGGVQRILLIGMRLEQSLLLSSGTLGGFVRSALGSLIGGGALSSLGSGESSGQISSMLLFELR